MISPSIALRPATRLLMASAPLPRPGVLLRIGGYLFWLLVAELLVNLWYLRTAIVLDGALLTTLLVHGSFAPPPERRFVVGLALAPLIRLISLALPLGSLPVTYAWALTGLTLLVGVVTVIAVLGLTREELALRLDRPRLQLAIGLLGLPIGTLGYLILRPASPVNYGSPWPALLVPVLVLLLFGGFLEELIFRGVLQATAWDLLGWRAVVLVAVLSAILSLGFLSVLYTMLVFAVGVLFGWLVMRTGSLLGVSLAHGLASVTLLMVLPLQ
jgi:membrane protease YdiL (CAAX protease family)